MPESHHYGKEAACVIAEARRMYYAVATTHQAKLVNLIWVQIQDRCYLNPQCNYNLNITEKFSGGSLNMHISLTVS